MKKRQVLAKSVKCLTIAIIFSGLTSTMASADVITILNDCTHSKIPTSVWLYGEFNIHHDCAYSKDIPNINGYGQKTYISSHHISSHCKYMFYTFDGAEKTVDLRDHHIGAATVLLTPASDTSGKICHISVSYP